MNLPIAWMPFAAGLDWLENLLPLLFVGFWILSQVYGVFRRVVGNGKPAQPPVRRPDVAPEPVRPPGVESLDKEIEEFLRRVTGSPQPAEPPRKPPTRQRPAPVKPAAQQPAGQRPKPTVVQKPSTQQLPSQHASSQQPPAVKPAVPAAVAMRQVRPLDRAGTELARHVQDAFAHDLRHDRPAITPAPSTLPPASRPPAVTRPATSAAAELAEALRHPATIRNAILLREVLDRPVDRW